MQILSQMQEVHIRHLCLLASPETPRTCGDWWQGVCTGPQTQPIDNLLNKQRGKKDILRSMQQWSTIPLLIQTACSIRPQNCTFHTGSKTTSVPVVTMKPADVNPPAPALTTLLTHETIETIVLWSGSSNLSRRRLVLLVDSQRWFLYPLFLISKALSGTSTVPQRTCRKMTWKEFKESAFYEMERQRCVAEKKK
ncbi:hypothetical protein G5714_004023 [Onychostoma macrolepis]|uniref:Uncharacterized protein n=1 Tax=Onychostoma macrolepis TaxID=369639 RepID=A0A7J6DCD9_9TELE|nr:hypothetical protein G5714_004023 [Onychostoma macrolepis]